MAEPTRTGDPVPDPFPGEFRFVRRLGSGAFGEVWLARDLNIQCPAAVKSVLPDAASTRAAQALALMREEASTLARIRHPNVVQVRTWRTAADGRHYLVMEYVAGGSMADRLKAGGPLPWDAAARYVADVGEGLRAVHKAGVVHRDVKPSNILWDDAADEARLADFGVATRMTDPGRACGTAAYMAPEAFEGDGKPAVDVYALAATLFELVAGVPPFDAHPAGLHLGAVMAGLPAPDPRLAGVPEPVERLIRGGLASDPAARPDPAAFVAGLRGALNQALGDAVVGAGRPGAAAVRLAVTRFDGRAGYVPVTATPLTLAPGRATRDMKKVPAAPPAARVRTGDRVRVTAEAARDGFLTVFNVGPTGNLNLLVPDDPSAPPHPVAAGRPVEVAEVELTPPAGPERVFAVWSRTPVPFSPADLHSLAKPTDPTVSRGYRATRDLKAVRKAVASLAPGEWEATGVVLDHRPD